MNRIVPVSSGPVRKRPTDEGPVLFGDRRANLRSDFRAAQVFRVVLIEDIKSVKCSIDRVHTEINGD